MNLAETYQPQTYLDLGFDQFMRKPFAISERRISASEFDAMFELGERQVRTSKLADFAVKNSKIDDAAITSAKIEDLAVTNAKIGDAEITNAKISDLSAEKITAGIITGRTLRTAEPAAGVGSSVVIEGGANKIIQFYYNETLRGSIKGYTTEGSEITYIDLEAASGRHIRLKNSMIEINGDLMPSSDEANSVGQSGRKWDNVFAQTLWQQTNTDGSRHVYDFAYIEKGLIGEKLLKKMAKKNNGVGNTNGYIPNLKLPFKLGTVLKWTAKGLKECEKENDLAIAVASDKGLPIVLGAEPVRIVGKAKIGYYVIPSNKKGCAIAIKNDELELTEVQHVIGICLENKKDSREKLTKVMIKF